MTGDDVVDTSQVDGVNLYLNMNFIMTTASNYFETWFEAGAFRQDGFEYEIRVTRPFLYFFPVCSLAQGY
jgi:hypothetical protein